MRRVIYIPYAVSVEGVDGHHRRLRLFVQHAALAPETAVDIKIKMLKVSNKNSSHKKPYLLPLMCMCVQLMWMLWVSRLMCLKLQREA